MEKFKIDWVINEVRMNPDKCYYTYNYETATFILVFIDDDDLSDVFIITYREFNDSLKGTEFADGGEENFYLNSEDFIKDFPDFKDNFYLEYRPKGFNDGYNFHESMIQLELCTIR